MDAQSAFAEYMLQPNIFLTVVASMVSILAFGAALALTIPKFTRMLIPQPKATRLGDQIKFTAFTANKRAIIGEDNMLTVVLSVRGTDLRFNAQPRQIALCNARQAWVEQMAEMNIRTRIFLIRDQLPRAANYTHRHGIMERVAAKWNNKLPPALSTEFYIVLSTKDRNGSTLLDEAIEQTKSILADYQVTELNQEYEIPVSVEDAPEAESLRNSSMLLGAFFGRLLAPISRPNAIGTRGEGLAYSLTTDNLRYDTELSMLVWSNGPRRKYAATFVIEEWATPQTEQHILDVISFPMEMIICHDVRPIPQIKALAELNWQARIAPGLQPGSDAAEQYATVAMAIERGSEEEQKPLLVQTMITILGDTPEEVVRGRNQLNQLKMVGINPVWPKHTMMQHWFGHFPGHDAQSRPQRILSNEVAILSPFQFTPSGKMDSDWGKGPIMMLKTLEGSPYAFQFHAGAGTPALGHCVAIGPSGQGKTTLITMLASMALRHPDLKAFFFDRGRGCEIITRALDGSYLSFDGDEGSVALNPLQMDDTPANRSFLRDWLAQIGGVKSTENELYSEIADAVEISFDPALDKRLRNLRKLYGSLFPAGSEMRQRLTAWTNPNQYGNIVCAEKDTLDISQRVGGFDFTDILTDERLGPAMVSYLMHRILVEAKGDPRLIFIDETEPLLRNPQFQMRYRKLLQEGRKERQVIVSAFQRPNAPDEIGIGDLIRGQCPTVFFFRNPAAKEEDYASWDLSRRELEFVMGRSYRKNRYAVLVKRYVEDAESVILDVDLNPLGKLMNIYHSGRKQVLLYEEMQQLHGDKALENYLAAV